MSNMDIQNHYKDRVSASVSTQAIDMPFEPNIESFKKWEQDLPLLDQHVSAEMLSTAVQAILSADISAVEKLELVEEAKHSLLRLYSVCKQAIENATFPLKKKQAESSSLLLGALTNCESIYSGLVSSKDFFAANTTEEGKEEPIFSDNTKSLIIFRSLEVLAAIQLLMSITYQLPKSSFWNAVNALFECAESLNIHQLEHLKCNQEDRGSIEGEFKIIHFFHLALPNRFKQGDIESIQSILSAQTNDILLSKTKDDAFEFYVDISSSAPASHQATLTNTNEMMRFLSNESIVKFLLSDKAIAHETHGAVSKASGQATLPKKVINRLIPSLKSGHKRQSERHAHSEDITIYPGFESIIRALIIKQNPDIYKKETSANNPFSLQKQDFELIPLEHDSNKHHLRYDDSDANRALKASSENELSSNSIWGKKHTSKPGEKGQKLDAKIKDSSLKGMRFTVPGDSKSLLKTTDLVGVQTKIQSTQLAIIRSINNLEDGCVSVGVEMMSPNLKVAFIKSHDENVSTKPAIFLQGIPAINQPDAIISPYLLEQYDVDIVLKLNHKKTTYLIDKTIESNQVFTHYTVSKKTNVD